MDGADNLKAFLTDLFPIFGLSALRMMSVSVKLHPKNTPDSCFSIKRLRFKRATHPEFKQKKDFSSAVCPSKTYLQIFMPC